MSMSEMDQGESGSKEDKIEELIELNHHGHNSSVNLQLPLANDSNNLTNMEGEHLHETSENANDKISLGYGQGKKRDAHLMGSNIQVDSVSQSKVPRVNVPPLATCSNNDRAHPEGASVCTNSQLQQHNDLPNTSAINAEHETDQNATAPMISNDAELTVTSNHGILNQNDDQQLSFILVDSRINKDIELIRAVRYGTNDELKNLLDLCQNKISFQLSQKALESSLIQAVRRGQKVKVRLLVYAGAQPASNYKEKDGYTALLVAAENGLTKFARFFLKNGADVNTINNNKDSALILSVKSSKSTELVELLLSHKANVNLENKYGFTALMKALETGDFDTCQLLIDAGADVNRSSRDGTALMQFVKSECGVKTCSTALEIMKLLLQNRTCTCSDWSRESRVLCVATRVGWTDMVCLLCEHGVEFNEICHNQTALMIASEFGHLEILEILLDHGASVNIKNALKLDALLIALKFGQVNCAKLLLSRGAHINLSTAAKLTMENKQTAAFQFLASQYKIDVNKDNLLHLAVKMGMEDTVSIMIKMGADVNKGDIYGETPLRVALSNNQGVSLIKCLLQNGACVNGSSDFAPLHWSMRYSVEITKLLLDSGANVNAMENFDEDTALIVACDKGLDIEIVKLLLAKGAQPNLKNKKGWTALHKATRRANVDLVQLLVKSGADLEIQTCDNETAYLLAASKGYIEVIQALQNLGANTSAVDSSGCNDLMLAIKFPKKKYIETSTLQYLAGNGAQINYQCNNGYTALMLATDEKVWELLKTLLDLGADVNITVSDGQGHNITALSILLENYAYYSRENFFYFVEQLIRHGAINSLPKSCNNVLHEMIARDKKFMVQLLLFFGMAPTMTSLQPYILRHHLFQNMHTLGFTELSPVTMALACGNIWVAQYLVENWALCPCDLNFLSLNKLRDFLVSIDKSESVEIVDQLLCQPASLLQLSFITVSHALGGVPGREDRINSLLLPQVIKEKLMFHEETVQINLTKNFSVINLDDYDSSVYSDYEIWSDLEEEEEDDFDDSNDSNNSDSESSSFSDILHFQRPLGLNSSLIAENSYFSSLERYSLIEGLY